MPVFTVPFEDFAGLDLVSAINETGGALDLFNVELDRPGRLRSRDGFTQVSAIGGSFNAGDTAILMPLIKAATNQTSPSYGVYGVATLAGPVGQLYDALTATAVGGVGTANLATQTTYALFGTPASDLLYFTGDGASRGASTTRGTLKKWDGTTLSSSVGKPFYVATTPWDNRLVQAGFDTAAGSPALSNGSQSTVWFSDAGLPDNYNGTTSQNAYVHLHPGDGERITGACTWRNFVIVTKETRMFVFWGTSTDATGQPIFNYRTVSLPFRIPENLPRAIVAGDDAFYLLSDHGVFASTGGTPALISQPINPALIGPVPATWSDYASVPMLRGLSYAMRRVWVHITAGSTARSFVLNLLTGQWSYSTIGSHVLSNSDDSGVYFVGNSSSSDNQTSGTVYLTSPSATTDAGAAITSRYRSAYVALDWRGRTIRSGIHGVDKTIRESLLEGTGTVTHKLANQWTQPASLPAGNTVTMGTSPQVAMARDRTAVRGRMFSWQINATGPWSLETLSWNVHGYQAAGEESDTR